jgi:hypothetical protein
MTADLSHANARLRETINQLVESHPELEVVVRDVALKQPPNPTPEQEQAICRSARGPQLRRAPTLEHSFGD